MKTMIYVFIAFQMFISMNLGAQEVEMEPVYKILRAYEWDNFYENGHFAGSEHDLRDGFIHLATAPQLERIIKKYFAGQRPLYIVKFSKVSFLELLIWELSSNSGKIYPHLYGRGLLIDDMESFEVID